MIRIQPSRMNQISIQRAMGRRQALHPSGKPPVALLWPVRSGKIVPFPSGFLGGLSVLRGIFSGHVVAPRAQRKNVSMSSSLGVLCGLYT
jgi:hypothetical protein